MAATRAVSGHERLIQTSDPMDVVFHANVAFNSLGDGQWRPLSSISHHSDNVPDEEQSERENDDAVGEIPSISLRSKSRVSIAPPAPSIQGVEDQIEVQGFASHPQRDPPPTRAASTASHRTNTTRRRNHRLRTAPGKLERQQATGQSKAFVTMDARTRVTADGIKGNSRTPVNAFGDRVCRPYSVYTVTRTCERLAISPFGGPLMNSAAGRYRERYLTKHRPDVVQDAPRGDSAKMTFQRFYDNLDLLAINVKRIPFGTLRKPPPKQARKPDNQTKSVPTQLHKYTSERVANLHESMDRTDGGSSPRVDGKRLRVMGVEYKVAMEVSSNLEKHRKSRPSNVPGLPNLIAARTDAPRLQTQSERLLTPGELSLKDGISSNLYDTDRSKRGPIKAIEKPPRRVKSPPLSKLSREKFYPEAQRRREQRTWTELRIGRPVTPPASEYTAVQSTSFATTVRPLTSMTTRTGGSESGGITTSAKDGAMDPLTQYANHQATEKADELCSQQENTTTLIAEPDEDNNIQSDAERMNENLVEFTKSIEGSDGGGTPLSSRSLVVTIPDDDGALGGDSVTNCEGCDEVTVQHVEDRSEEDKGNVIADNQSVEPAHAEERSENADNETDTALVKPAEQVQIVNTGDQLVEPVDQNQSVNHEGQPVGQDKKVVYPGDQPVDRDQFSNHGDQPVDLDRSVSPDDQPVGLVEQDQNVNLDDQFGEHVEQVQSVNPGDEDELVEHAQNTNS